MLQQISITFYQIEEINVPLLNYFYENNDKLVVLFYESDDRDADEIIEGLEGSGHNLIKLASWLDSLIIEMLRNE